MPPGAVMQTSLPLPGRRQGKVRDVYTLPARAGGPGTAAPERLLIVATDRLSAFDVVMPTPVPGKGALLTQMAAFWLRFVEQRGIGRTHLLSTALSDADAAAIGPQAAALAGRVTIARVCAPLPVEFVVRGYLEGSGWKEYQQTGAVCGVPLPRGLRQCDRLPEPIFTPATKAEKGEHDENISQARAAEIVDAVAGPGACARLGRVALEIYRAAAAHALARGVIIADTKFEFGVPADEPGGEAILIDEALTPDSSRFWPADGYEPGRPQRSYDKQFVREYLEGLVARGLWNKQSPGPVLPDEVVAGTLARYREALERLTGA